MKAQILSIMLAMLMTSCASVVNGSKQRIRVDSIPQGASVTAVQNGKVFHTVTPGDLVLRRKWPALVTVDLQGYTPTTQTIESTFSLDSTLPVVGNGVFGPAGLLVGGLYDAQTGAIKTLTPDNISIKLQHE